MIIRWIQKTRESSPWFFDVLFVEIVLVIIAATLLGILIEIYRIEDGLDQFRPVRSYHFAPGAITWDVAEAGSVFVYEDIKGAIDALEDELAEYDEETDTFQYK